MKNILVIGLLIFTTVTAFANEVTPITAEQLVSIQQAEKKPRHVILDVRSAEEFSQGHLAGAINIPHDEVAQRLEELSGFKHDMVIVHCRSGRRAKVAEAVLTEQGFSKVKHLEGDFIGWQKKQLPIVKQ
ncbi:rhodanese-like domain-containing protein [Thalassotalea marina]|uniref:Rhodanese-like domain-containing protein n=1 Tax=Thalassotalea marina TaxID=1673741 RepID=A0A919EH27_9GAMM|nr:rhodanese-like domain-containing protein [Thalassotalea marina]GHF77205.1 rhodanese-like domain-containing protein [Thalassotalea marina]